MFILHIIYKYGSLSDNFKIIYNKTKAEKKSIKGKMET